VVTTTSLSPLGASINMDKRFRQHVMYSQR
jgi:hypothetical protein